MTDIVGKTATERFRERVAAERVRRGLSISDLARLCDISRPHLSKIASGRHAPSLETAEKIAVALGSSLARLCA